MVPKPAYFAVYIDYNHNGSFNDPGELVTELSTSSTVSKSFTVPTTALNGSTRMRVQMQLGSYETNPCASFTSGGVQDYTVNITGNAHIDIPERENEQADVIKLYPDPAKDNINVQFISSRMEPVRLNIYSLTGRRLISEERPSWHGMNILNINISSLPAGSYIFEMEGDGEVKHQKFIVAR